MAPVADIVQWIALDWGTSNCRAWAVAEDGSILDEVRSPRGMNSVNPAEFEPLLLGLIAPWLGDRQLPVVACGMLGSRQGWVEAPYRKVPCEPVDFGMARARVSDPRIAVFVVPGLRQDSPADVMRGEETQIAGFLAAEPKFDGVLCLPGTHTKWAHISAGEVVSFRTFMTGDLFAAISGHSVLKHSIGDGWDADAFHAAVADTLSRPEALAQRLFSLRSETLLFDLKGDAAKARLSGHLVGAELAAARAYWLGQDVVVIGDATSEQTYVPALAAQGITAHVVNADEMTRAGLAMAHGLQKDTVE